MGNFNVHGYDFTANNVVYVLDTTTLVIYDGIFLYYDDNDDTLCHITVDNEEQVVSKNNCYPLYSYAELAIQLLTSPTPTLTPTNTATPSTTAKVTPTPSITPSMDVVWSDELFRVDNWVASNGEIDLDEDAFITFTATDNGPLFSSEFDINPDSFYNFNLRYVSGTIRYARFSFVTDAKLSEIGSLICFEQDGSCNTLSLNLIDSGEVSMLLYSGSSTVASFQVELFSDDRFDSVEDVIIGGTFTLHGSIKEYEGIVDFISPTPSQVFNTPTPTPSLSPSITPSTIISPSISLTPTPSETPSVTPTITPTISLSPSNTPSNSFLPSATPSVTPTISITPSVTPSTTIIPSLTPSATISVTPSITVSNTISVTPSITPTISITPSITPSSTISITPTITPTISLTQSTTVSPTISVTPSISSSSPGPSVSPSPSAVVPSPTPSVTATISVTPTISLTNSLSVTPTITNSISVTPSVTPTITVTNSPSITPSITVSPTISVTPSITQSISITPSITTSATPPVSSSVTPTLTITPSVTPTITVSPSDSLTPTPSQLASPTPTPTISITPTLVNTFGTELVTNGNFSSPTISSQFTPQNATLSVDGSNRLVITSNAVGVVSTTIAMTGLSLALNSIVRFTFNYYGGSAGMPYLNVVIRNSSGSTVYYMSTPNLGGVGTFTTDIRLSLLTTSLYLVVTPCNAITDTSTCPIGETYTLDNFSIRQILS